MSELKQWRTKLPLRTFVGHLLDVKLPVWVWWALIALALVPVSLGVAVKL